MKLADVTSIMDSPTLGLWHSLQTSYQSLLISPLLAHSDKWPYMVIRVYVEVGAGPKELVWTGKGSLFYWHPRSCTRHGLYGVVGWY